MEPSRTPARRIGLVGVALALALGVSSCASGPASAAPAATVDDVEISQQDVLDLVESSRTFYEQAAELGLDQTGQYAALVESSAGAGTDTVAMDEASNAVFSLIQSEVIRAELARQDALPTDDDRQAIRTELETQVGGKETLDEIDQAFLDFSIESRAMVQAYQQLVADEQNAAAEAPDPAEVEAQRQDLYEQLVEAQPLCLGIILTATEDDAAAARARVDGGEAFADVAADASIDPTTAEQGGYAGCATPEQAEAAFVESFADVAVGDIVGPVTFTSPQGGEPQFAVIEIVSTDGPTFEQALPQLEQQVPSEAPVVDPATVDISIPLAGLYAAADISVDPRFGSWDDELNTVVPPVAPADPSAPSTTATTAPLISVEPGS